ncbi:putative signal transducing protein [Rubricoccus marinus]|uniref:RanBP2-type domain-containing protein n=1 Tax=Rubricoccus marinus TaxID=716817 RepID=A0A259TZX8_9BACT|nr:DUF2007 domain-containing protein [Rubricoccus marinus]OZC03302.1 hypothetical protein BSZ36_10110 [Rubricoccus marinus]
MTRVYSHPDPSIAHLVRGALENAGITAIVQGDQLGAAMGEVPPIAAWAEVWVKDGDRLEDARSLVVEVMADPEVDAQPWTCPSCGEVNDAQFAVCWNCGTDIPDAPEA